MEGSWRLRQKAVAGCADSDILFGAVFLMLIIILGVIAFDQGQLDASGSELLEQVAGIAEVQLDIDLRMTALESGQRADNRIFTDGHGHTKGQALGAGCVAVQFSGQGNFIIFHCLEAFVEDGAG